MQTQMKSNVKKWIRLQAFNLMNVHPGENEPKGKQK